jgi:hypothetical protein
MSTLLLESGFVKSRQKQGDTNTAYNYISFMTPRVILILNDLHKDHMNPKGLMTDIPKLFQLSTIKQDDEDTLYDRDDNYQKEILDEVDLSDLYT